MKKKLLILSMIIGCFMVSCNPDNNSSDDNDAEQYTVDPAIEANSSFLFGTTWKFDRWVDYNKNGMMERWGTSSIYFTLTFTSDLLDDDFYILDVNNSYVPEMHTYWHVDEDGLTYYATDYAYYLGYSTMQVAEWNATGAIVGGAPIIKSGDKLIVKFNSYDDGSYKLYYYTRIK